MTSTQVLNENPLTLVELKDKLTNLKKRDKELSERGNKTKEYLDMFTSLTPKKVEVLKKKLNDLNVSRLKARHVAMIINVLPEDIDSLRTVFSGETITVKQEDLKRIVDVVNDYI